MGESNHKEPLYRNSNVKSLLQKVDYIICRFPWIGIVVEYMLFLALSICVYFSIAAIAKTMLLCASVALPTVYLITWFRSRWTFCYLCLDGDAAIINHIRKTERRRQRERWGFYSFIVFLILNANFLHCGLTQQINCVLSVIFRTNMVAIKACGLIVLSIALFICSFETISRSTFRKWPVYALSAAVVCLFLVFMDGPYQNSTLTWGLVDMSAVTDILNNPDNQIKNSIFVVSAVSFVCLLVKDRWIKYQKRLANDTIKETRRQLLTHWKFRPMYQLSNESLNKIILFFVLMCLLAGFIVLPNSSNNKATEAATQDHITNYADISAMSSNKESNSGEFYIEKNIYYFSELAENKDTKANRVSFTGYVYLLATVLAAFGIVCHFDVSNKSLIECEYYYLLYHALDPAWDDASDSVGRLRMADYFQVLSYLYSNGSTIKSEEQGWHKLNTVINELNNRSCAQGECEQHMFFSRMLYSYAEIKNQLFLNEGVKENGADLTDKLRSEAIVPIPEALFSKEAIMLLQKEECRLYLNIDESSAKKAGNCLDPSQGSNSQAKTPLEELKLIIGRDNHLLALDLFLEDLSIIQIHIKPQNPNDMINRADIHEYIESYTLDIKKDPVGLGKQLDALHPNVWNKCFKHIERLEEFYNKNIFTLEKFKKYFEADQGFALKDEHVSMVKNLLKQLVSSRNDQDFWKEHKTMKKGIDNWYSKYGTELQTIVSNMAEKRETSIHKDTGETIDGNHVTCNTQQNLTGASASQSELTSYSNAPLNLNVLQFISLLQSAYFSSEICSIWQHRLATVNVPAEEFIQTVKADVLAMIVQRENSNDCLLNWLCEKPYCPTHNSHKTHNEYKFNRRLLLMEYPFLVNLCAMKRIRNWDIVSRDLYKFYRAFGNVMKHTDYSELFSLIIPFCSFLTANLNQSMPGAKVCIDESIKEFEDEYKGTSEEVIFKQWINTCCEHFLGSPYFETHLSERNPTNEFNRCKQCCCERTDTEPEEIQELDKSDIGKFSVLLSYDLFADHGKLAEHLND